jgi:hypothetical protein
MCPGEVGLTGTCVAFAGLLACRVSGSGGTTTTTPGWGCLVEAVVELAFFPRVELLGFVLGWGRASNRACFSLFREKTSWRKKHTSNRNALLKF